MKAVYKILIVSTLAGQVAEASRSKAKLDPFDEMPLTIFRQLEALAAAGVFQVPPQLILQFQNKRRRLLRSALGLDFYEPKGRSPLQRMRDAAGRPWPRP